MVWRSQLTLQRAAETKETEASAQIAADKGSFTSGRRSDLTDALLFSCSVVSDSLRPPGL